MTEKEYDEPLLKPEPLDATRTLGDLITRVTVEQCAVWPRGEVPDAGLPTLFLKAARMAAAA